MNDSSLFRVFKNKPLYWIGTTLTICFLIFISLYEPPKTFSEKDQSLPDFTFENVTISELENGDLKWEISAESASIYKDNTTLHMSNVSGNFLNKNSPIIFSSEEGDLAYNNPTSFVLYNSSVTLNLKENLFNFKSHTLHISAESLFGDKGNTITSQGLILSSNKLKLNLSEKKLYIYENARAIFQTKKA